MAVLAGVALVYWRAWVCDDAYITFRFVDNLLNGYGPVFYPGERVQGYTHPLWFMLLALGGTVLPLHAWAVTMSLLCTALTLWRLGTWLTAADPAPDRRAPAILALAFVAFALLSSSTFIDFQTSGLESPLTHLLIVLIVVRVLPLDPTHRASPRTILLLCGLLILNRYDRAAVCAPVMLLAFAQLVRTRRARAISDALLTLSPLIAWLVFSLIYYGSPFPNTAYCKLGEFGWRQGSLYAWNYLRHQTPSACIVLLALIGGSVASIQRWRRGDVRLAAVHLGLCLDVLYVISIGGDYMRGRFFTAPLLVSAMVIAHEIATRATPRHWNVTARVMPLALCGVAFVRLTNWFIAGAMSGFISLQRMDTPALVLVSIAGATSIGLLILAVGRRAAPAALLATATLLQLLSLAALAGWIEITWIAAALFGTILIVGPFMLNLPPTIRAARVPVLLCAILTAVGFMARVQSRQYGVSLENGITDESCWYAGDPFEPRFRLPDHTSTDYPRLWTNMGLTVRRYADVHGPIAVDFQAIGYLSYAAGPKVRIIDWIGLCDAYVARCPARSASRPGHVEREIPQAYYDAMLLLPFAWGDKDNQIARLDPTPRQEVLARQPAALAAMEADPLYRLVRTVISGPIWSAERWRAMWRFNFPQRTAPAVPRS